MIKNNKIADIFYQFIKSKKFRYLLIGGINTVLGYSICAGIYLILGSSLHVIIIGIICNVLVISFNFFTYKIFVFKTKGNWLREYFCCYIIYGLSSCLSIIGVWVLVDFIGVNFYAAVACTMAIAVVFSWFGHSRFTYVNAPKDKHE